MSKRPVPPSANRFKKGQSGNPKGRPRKKAAPPASASVFDIIIDRTLSLTRDGIPQEVGIEEALQHRTYQDAIAGSRMARREILKMILKRERTRAKRAPPPEGVKLVTEHDPENANAAMLILRIVGPDDSDWGPNDIHERLLLEPWAVEAALKRRRRREIGKKGLADIRRCTRSPEQIAWPQGVDQ